MMLSATARAALEGAELDGAHVRIVQQLERKDYQQVNTVLERLGGKWERRAKAHVFPEPVGERLAQLLADGELPPDPKKEEAFFATPPELALQVVRDYTEVEDLQPGAWVLEPSAGDGALVRAVMHVNSELKVIAVEPNAARAARIEGATEVWASTIEDYPSASPTRFEAVVMNPPFALPGHPTAWIDHIDLAWRLVRPGGRLTAIAPVSLRYRQDRRHTTMRDLVDTYGGWERLPEDAFEASGTGVRTVVLWMNKPVPTEPEEEPREEPIGQLAMDF